MWASNRYLFLLSAEARTVLFSGPTLIFFLFLCGCNNSWTTALSLMKFLWTCTLRTSRTLNFKVRGQANMGFEHFLSAWYLEAVLSFERGFYLFIVCLSFCVFCSCQCENKPMCSCSRQRRERAVSSSLLVSGNRQSAESCTDSRHGGFGQPDTQRCQVRSDSVLFGGQKEPVLHVHNQRTQRHRGVMYYLCYLLFWHCLTAKRRGKTKIHMNFPHECSNWFSNF